VGGVLGRLTHPHGAGLTDGGRVVACSTAIFFAGAAVLHVSAAADHENLPVMLVGFLCVATCQAAIAGLLLWRRPGALLLIAALALTAGAVGTWLISRTLGLPFLPGGHMEPIGFKDGVTVLFELASIPGLLLLGSRELAGVRLPSSRLGSQAIAGLGATAFALFVPAVMLGGGGHHSAAQLASGGHSHGEEAAGHPHGEAGEGEQLASADGSDHGHAGDHAGGTGESSHAHGSTGASSPGLALDGGTLGGASHGHAGGTGLDGHADGGDGHVDSGGGHTDGGGGHANRGHGGGGHGNGGGHGDGGAGHGGGGHSEPEAGHGDGGHGEDGHGDEPGQAAGNGGIPTFDDPGSMSWGGHTFDYEPARPGKDGKVGNGYALVYRGQADSSTGTVGHHSEEPCNPTPDQQAAADELYRQTWPAVRQYDNNFAKAFMDGFTYLFPLTDRITHMVNVKRVNDPTILDPAQIESFLYVMTDDGLTAIGGMYVMPKFGMPGPQIGGCLTRWHEHAGVAGRLTTAGTQDRTPEMLHVWTYRGLDPWEHYDGRHLSQLWTPGSVVPSVCRQSGDASDACLP
jgi:hypothetical protein